MFHGVKVLSFTHFLQGPSAVQMLADLGADVVKIESPTGAYERHWSGFDAHLNNVSVFFLLGNRNQRSLSVNLRTDEGKEIIYRMIKNTDILVENFRPGVMQRLGFDYEKLKEINPRLIYCSCTGYGSDGPYRDLPGQDLLLQSRSGLTTLTGRKNDPPTPIGTAIVDQHAAVLGAFGIAAALFDREKTGQGRKVESNLLNAGLDLQIEPFNYFLNKGELWSRVDTGLGTRFHQSPYGVYKTKDNWVTISLTPMEKLRKAFTTEKLLNYTQQDQMLNRDEVDAIIAEELLKKTTQEWFQVFEELEIWCAPVNTYEDIVKDPQVEWNKMITKFNHPDAGEVHLLNHPVKYEGYETGVKRYPPRLGEHTDEVLRENHFSEEEIQKLIQEKVVVSFEPKK